MEIVYWNERVERFVKGLDSDVKVRVQRAIDLLEQRGHLLDMPEEVIRLA